MSAITEPGTQPQSMDALLRGGKEPIGAGRAVR